MKWLSQMDDNEQFTSLYFAFMVIIWITKIIIVISIQTITIAITFKIIYKFSVFCQSLRASLLRGKSLICWHHHQEMSAAKKSHKKCFHINIIFSNIIVGSNDIHIMIIIIWDSQGLNKKSAQLVFSYSPSQAILLT